MVPLVLCEPLLQVCRWRMAIEEMYWSTQAPLRLVAQSKGRERVAQGAAQGACKPSLGLELGQMSSPWAPLSAPQGTQGVPPLPFPFGHMAFAPLRLPPKQPS